MELYVFGKDVTYLREGVLMSDSDKIVVETEGGDVTVSPENVTVEPVDDPDQEPSADEPSGEDNEESEEVVPPNDDA